MMHERKLDLVHDYKQDDALRGSFMTLARQVFGLELESWHRNGCWNDRYIPYSFADKGEIVANVSVNLLELILDGRAVKAAQLGTVMTHPDYRKQGLSAALMRHVLKEYEERCELIYLFANPTARDFYSKFGFEPVGEDLFCLDWPRVESGGAADEDADIEAGTESDTLHRLDVNQAADFAFLRKLAAERLPVSRRFGTAQTEGLLMFYALSVFPDHLYVCGTGEDAVVVICSWEKNRLELYDVVSRKPVKLMEICRKLANANPGTEKVVFHFTPDEEEGLELQRELYDGGLMVREKSATRQYPPELKHPMTSIA